MQLSNQVKLSKAIYGLHRNNGGRAGYIHFREVVPERMSAWISRMYVTHPRQTRAIDDTGDSLYSLNKKFINDNYELYEVRSIHTNNLGAMPGLNVYRNDAIIGYSMNDDGSINTAKKNLNNMRVEDIQSMDVWAKQTVEIDSSVQRYGNVIPPWQRTMHARHVDRGNEGFRTTQERASLISPVYGYGDDMKALQQLVEERTQANW
jgi:hypothetical protein